LKTLIPTWDRVLIKRVDSVNGIIIPASVSSQTGMQRGLIQACGVGVRKVKPGEEVFFTHPANAPTDLIEFDGQEYVVIPEDSVVAVVREA